MEYEVPTEVKELAKALGNFTYSNGLEISQVFNDFLTYIIGFFTPEVKPLPNWKYSREQNESFQKMLLEWIQIMNKQIYLHQWYDAFGELYMGVVTGKSRQQNRGQFFTPNGICDLMTGITNTNEKPEGKYISDPACGSGRTLLSWHVNNLGNYLCAEDIDRTCCMMAVCNFLIHGCVGEVIWHDSLDPNSFFGGWKINERLNTSKSSPIPLITVREIKQEESVTFRIWNTKLKAKHEGNSSKVNMPAAVQLSLF